MWRKWVDPGTLTQRSDFILSTCFWTLARGYLQASVAACSSASDCDCVTRLNRVTRTEGRRKPHFVLLSDVLDTSHLSLCLGQLLRLLIESLFGFIQS